LVNKQKHGFSFGKYRKWPQNFFLLHICFGILKNESGADLAAILSSLAAHNLIADQPGTEPSSATGGLVFTLSSGKGEKNPRNPVNPVE